MKYILNCMQILVGHSPRKFNFLILFFISTLLIGCKKNQASNSKEPHQNDVGSLQFEDLPESFKTFYIKFHNDSSFQMEHIVFPLEGLPDHADPEDVNVNPFYYTMDQWTLHKMFDPKTNNIIYLKLGSIIIEERITEKKYGLTIIRRFADSSSGWRLIYYGGLNKYIEN